MEYQQRYTGLNSRYESVKKQLDDIAAERQLRVAQKGNILQFIEAVRQRDSLLTGFDEGLWRSAVESVMVHSLEDIRVKMRDGREIVVSTKR